MRFRILGPLQVTGSDGRPCRLEPRQARVLAALLLAPNRTVPRQQLIDAAWDSGPPATAARQIQNCVSALRRWLGSGLVGDAAGYRMQVAAGELDSLVFARWIGEARGLADRGAPAEAADRLRQALALWRGPALAGIEGHSIQTAAARLDEERLTAIERCVGLELAIGRAQELVGELTELAATYPLRETLVGQLMLALHRSGRRADALAAYQDLRARLAGELGLDPGERLRELHTSILRDEAGAPVAGTPVGTVVPRQLPAPVRHFVGRAAELKEMSGLIDTPAAAAGTVIISAIDGSGGIGKTALALHWAHRTMARFPDGQLYVNLRGYDPAGLPASPAEAVRGFLEALGVVAERIPAGLEARAALYRSLLADRRVLVVLDNARDAEQVRPLLPGAGDCLAVITSRNRLTSLIAVEGAYPIALELLTYSEAHELLARHLGPERLDDDPMAADALITGCARLPLALAIVAARAATERARPLAEYADELADARRRLDALDAGDRATQVRAVFSWSHERLGAPAARLFRLLGVHPGPDISAPAAASLTGESVPRARTLLGELTRAHLLSETSPGRYSFHDLLRVYAGELAHELEPAGERRVALHRALEFYLHSGHAAALALHPARPDPVVLPQIQPDVVPDRPADREAALTWFTAERPVLLGIIRGAAEAGFDRHVWQQSWTLANFLEMRGHWGDWVEAQTEALAATERLGDQRAQAKVHNGLGIAHAHLGQLEEAQAHYLRALDLFGRFGDAGGQARVSMNICWSLEARGDRGQALAYARRAGELYQAAGSKTGLADALNGIGWLHALGGEHELALEHCELALVLQQEVGSRLGEAATWDSLGYAHRHLGHHTRAIACYERSVALYREYGDRYRQADVLHHLGDAHAAAGDPGAAHAAWLRSLSLLERLGHPDVDGVRARLAQSAAPGTV